MSSGISELQNLGTVHTKHRILFKHSPTTSNKYSPRPDSDMIKARRLKQLSKVRPSILSVTTDNLHSATGEGRQTSL